MSDDFALRTAHPLAWGLDCRRIVSIRLGGIGPFLIKSYCHFGGFYVALPLSCFPLFWSFVMAIHRTRTVVFAWLLILVASRAADAASLFVQQVIADSATAFWQLNDANKSNGATAVSTVSPGTYNGAYQWGNQAGNSVTSVAAAYPALGTAADFHNSTANTSLAGSDVVVAPNTGLPTGSSDRTEIFWVQTSTPTDLQYHAATDYGTPGTSNADFGTAVFASNDPNSPKGGMGVSQWGDGTGTTSVVNDGNWHFFAVTVSGGGTSPTYDVYMDGVLQNSKSMATSTARGCRHVHRRWQRDWWDW